MKGIGFIVIALFIDGVQAAVSATLILIAAFPGTIGGAAAGCAAGNAVAGGVGCEIGGFLLGLLGSIPIINGGLALIAEPIGLVLGFAISICLSATLGFGLIMLLVFNGMFYPKYVYSGGIAELIPGFDLIPGWTAMTILSVIKKNKEEKQEKSGGGKGLISRGVSMAINATPEGRALTLGAAALTSRSSALPARNNANGAFAENEEGNAQGINSADRYMTLKNSVDGIRAPRAATPSNDNNALAPQRNAA